MPHLIKKYKKCFVTVGTTRFDMLCEYVQSTPVLCALKRIGCTELTCQIGNSANIVPGSYEVEGVTVNLYRFKDSIEEDIQSSDLIISHAGAGTCLEALGAKKPLLVVVNEELMNNHQLELAEQLQVDCHIYYCTCDTLESTLNIVDFKFLVPFPKPNPAAFINYMNQIFNIK